MFIPVIAAPAKLGERDKEVKMHLVQKPALDSKSGNSKLALRLPFTTPQLSWRL